MNSVFQKSFLCVVAFYFLCFTLKSQNADIDLLRNINLNRNRSLDPTFIGISNSVTPLIIAVPVGLLTASLIEKDSTQKQKAFTVCTSVIGAAIISTSLKYGVHRTRPFVTYPEIEKATSGGSPSFPSGHTSAAFSLATSVSLAYPKWYIIAPSFLWASAVGYSRMDLGVHYPTDVLAGAIIGSGSAILSYKVNKWILKKRRK